METRAVVKFSCLQRKGPKEIRVILAETFARFLPGRVKDFSAPPVYLKKKVISSFLLTVTWHELFALRM